MLTTVNRIRLLVWDLDAELLLVRQTHLVRYFFMNLIPPQWPSPPPQYPSCQVRDRLRNAKKSRADGLLISVLTHHLLQSYIPL